MVVKRPKLSLAEQFYLPAIAAGLAITLKHLRKLVSGKTKVTMQYPEERWDSQLPPWFRGAPVLVKDEHGKERCVACQIPPRIPGRRSRSATQAEVRVFILDNLYRALPRPPSVRKRLRKLPVGCTTTCGNEARATRTCSRREISGISQPDAACVASRAPTFRTLSDTQCANIGAIPAGASIARYAA